MYKEAKGDEDPEPGRTDLIERQAMREWPVKLEVIWVS